MKTILIPTDFSPSALNAAFYAADMALAINADILVLHVYEVPVSYSEIPAPFGMDNIVDDLGSGVLKLKEQLARRTGGKVNISTEVRMGVFFYRELRVVCDQVRPYAVVMGSQGTTKSERLFFGGHTVHAMRHLKWPLITVPPGCSFSSIKKIGLACDFNNVIRIAPLDEIKLLLNDFNAELHILNTHKHEIFSSEIVYESGLFHEMFSSLKPEYHFILNENTDEGIMKFAEANHIDLLIVLPRRHDVITKLIHKSHTKQFVLHSHVPVMALHNVAF
jgi:nucleotide-binding universal stress UspA family protein